LSPSTLFAVPQTAGLPVGRERLYLDSGIHEVAETPDYLPPFLEDLFLLFFFVGIYFFTQIELSQPSLRCLRMEKVSVDSPESGSCED
jgi:hypothetical protein